MDKFELYSSMVMHPDTDSEDENDIIQKDMMAINNCLVQEIEVLKNERETFYSSNELY